MTKGVKGNFARAQDELHLGPQFFPILAQEIHAGIGRKSALTCARPLLPSVMILNYECRGRRRVARYPDAATSVTGSGSK